MSEKYDDVLRVVRYRADAVSYQPLFLPTICHARNVDIFFVLLKKANFF